MTVVVYAIAEGIPDSLDALGLAGARLDTVTEGRLTAVVADQPAPDGSPNADALWRYERVIETLNDRHSIVPMRYGSRLGDREEVGSMLRDRQAELTAAVRRITGAVELSVRAQYREPPTAEPPGSGREYMLERVERHRKITALRRHLERLEGLSRAYRLRELRPPALGVQAAFLVEPGRVEAFTDRLSELEALIPEADLTCTGPWPPYTFAQEPPS